MRGHKLAIGLEEDQKIGLDICSADELIAMEMDQQ